MKNKENVAQSCISGDNKFPKWVFVVSSVLSQM